MSQQDATEALPGQIVAYSAGSMAGRLERNEAAGRLRQTVARSSADSALSMIIIGGCCAQNSQGPVMIR